MSSENMILLPLSLSRLFIIILLEKKEKENSGKLYLALVKSIYVLMQKCLHLTLLKN